MVQFFKKFKKRYWILLILGLIILFFSIKSKFSVEEENKDDFTSLTSKTIENKQLISGKLSSSKEVNMKSELAGIVDALFVSVGDEVKKGQAIAKIKILPDPKSTQDAQRQIELAKINLEKVQAVYNRNKMLYDKEVIPRQEFEISVQEFKSAQLELSAAINYLKIVQQGFSKKTDFVSNVIYSTIDGLVLDIPVKVGGTIQSRNNFNEGTTIATIADVTDFIFKGQVSEKDLKYLELGKEMKIKINALNAEKFTASISRIAPKGVDIAGITRFDIEAKLNMKPTEMYKIKSGFTATAEFLITQAKNVLALEEKYIIYNEDTAYVYIKSTKDKVRKILSTGISDGQFIEIKSGINKQDKIYKENKDESKIGITVSN